MHRTRRTLVTAAGVLLITAVGIGAPKIIRGSSHNNGGSGGAGGSPYEPAHQITAGGYQSSVAGRYATPGAEERGSAAMAAEQSMPPFAGWINGIYIYPDASNAPSGFVPDKAAAAGPVCPGAARVVSEDELKVSGYYIDIPGWLPPGAVEHEQIYGEACGSRITLVSRQFELQPYGARIGLVLRPGATGAPFPAVANRVRQMTVNGLPAALVAPLTDEGFGNSALFVRTSRGLLQVGALDVRLSDLLAVADSIK